MMYKHLMRKQQYVNIMGIWDTCLEKTICPVIALWIINHTKVLCSFPKVDGQMMGLMSPKRR